MIRNLKHLMRPLFYDGMQFGKLTPMDGDAILDIKGRGFMFFEVKCANAPLSQGQRYCLQNMVDALSEVRTAVAVLCDWNDCDDDSPMFLKDCVVRSVYRDGKWKQVPGYIKVKDFTSSFIDEIYEKYAIKRT